MKLFSIFYSVIPLTVLTICDFYKISIHFGYIYIYIYMCIIPLISVYIFFLNLILYTLRNFLLGHVYQCKCLCNILLN